MPEISTKPYLLRAIYEWCTDNGFTPYLAVMVDGQTRVPMQFVKNGEIVLNISFDATSGLKMGNEVIEFSARFSGTSRDISVPIENVIAIYARENGQGMAFEVSPTPARDVGNPAVPAHEPSVTPSESQTAAPTLTSVPPTVSASVRADTPPADDPTPPKKGGRPTLTRIK